MNPIPPFFDYAEPDPIGILLGTGYWRFTTPFGSDGLAKWEGSRLDVLAIGSKHKGEGSFRLFVEQAKKHFREVYFWHDMNPLIGEALKRYGFAQTSQIENGEKMDGWKWKESHTPRTLTAAGGSQRTAGGEQKGEG